MRITFNSICLLVLAWCFAGCATHDVSNAMDEKVIMEVTTFRINAGVDPAAFAQRDAAVENDFTGKQNGFITRQSGVDEEGNYVVVVYWETMADADASMNKFMRDESVADYAGMIDATTMKMARYAMDESFEAKESRFVEIMSFDLKEGTDLAQFNEVNQKVETEFTGKREGFIQRLTGVDESGRQVVAIYWASKELSDASLQPFMEAPIAKEFMAKMDQSSMMMGRYKFF